MNLCSLIHMGKIRNLFQVSNDFHPPLPRFPRGGHVFVHNFCIYFWKRWRGTWTINIGVRHTSFSYPLLCPVHSTYYMTISVWWWSSLTIDVPHVDFHSTHVMISLLIIIVDFRLWWVPLLMIFLVVYTFILVDFHWWFPFVDFHFDELRFDNPIKTLYLI